MDIQKEREAFEEFYKTQILVKDYEIAVIDQLTEFHIETGLYEYARMQTAWEAWQAAKAQAVPEGFVLVNKKDLVKVLNCVTDDWLVDTDSFEEFKKIESLVQDGSIRV